MWSTLGLQEKFLLLTIINFNGKDEIIFNALYKTKRIFFHNKVP